MMIADVLLSEGCRGETVLATLKAPAGGSLGRGKFYSSRRESHLKIVRLERCTTHEQVERKNNSSFHGGLSVQATRRGMSDNDQSRSRRIRWMMTTTMVLFQSCWS
jgi:hypothetical protein